MSFETYAKFYDEVTDLLSRGDLAGKVPSWIQMVEGDCQKTIRDFRETIIEETGNLVPGQASLELPEGFREIVLLRFDTTPEKRLSLVSSQKLIDVRVSAGAAGLGTPIAGMLMGERTLLLEPAPEADDPYTLYYHGTPSPSDRSGAQTSQILRDAPELLLYGCAYHGAIYTQNGEMKVEYKTEYENFKRTYAVFLFRAKTSGGELRARPDSMPNDSYSREISRA